LQPQRRTVQWANFKHTLKAVVSEQLLFFPTLQEFKTFEGIIAIVLLLYLPEAVYLQENLN
jgi:hypothetical protein